MNYPLNILDEQLFSHTHIDAMGTSELVFHNPTFNYQIHPDIPKGIRLSGWKCRWLSDYSILEVYKVEQFKLVFRLKLFANFDASLTEAANNQH